MNRHRSRHLIQRGTMAIGGACLFAMLLCGGMAQAADLTIAGNPLRITSNEYLSVQVARMQGRSFVRQYFSTYQTTLRLGTGPAQDRTLRVYGETASAPYGFSPVPGGHTQPDANTIDTAVTMADAVRIDHTISYSSGAEIFRHRWVVTNNGKTTYGDVALRYGGDTFFAGMDTASGYFDANLGMVFCKNPEISGLMGILGAPDTPADGYYEARYDLVNDAIQGVTDLPNSVDPAFIDNGMALEWRRATLAPGESITIVAYEKWTESGAIQVIAPAPLAAVAGEIVSITFTVQNLQNAEDEVTLSGTVPAGWAITLPASVQLGPQASVPVTAQITIPTGTPAGIGQVKLTLTKLNQQDVVFTHSDQVTVTVTGDGEVPPPVVIHEVPLSSGERTIYAAVSPSTAQGATSILSSLSGVPDTVARAFAWDNSVQAYAELPSEIPVGGVVPATGIFIATRQTLNYSLAGTPTQADDFSLAVRHDGWTFAGIPVIEIDGDYATSFRWPSEDTTVGIPIQVLYNSDASLADAMGTPGGDISTSRPWFWNGEEYVQVGVLESGKGYWFKNNLGEDITIRVSGPQVVVIDDVARRLDREAGASGTASAIAVSVRDQGSPPPPPAGSRAASSASSGGGCGSGSGVAAFGLLMLMVSLRFLIARR